MDVARVYISEPVALDRLDESGLGVRGVWGATLVYGLAHYGKSLFWYASEFLFAFFLTEVGGISADRMGLILAAGLFVGAGIDVGVGARLSRALPSVRSAGRLQFAGSVASASSMVMMFACYWLPDHFRLAAALATSLAFRVSYALYDIPQNSLLSLATRNDQARTNISAMRYMFSGLASLTIAAALPTLLWAGPRADRAVRFFTVASALSLVSIATALLLAQTLAGVRSNASETTASTTRAPRLGRDVGLLIGLMFVVSMAGPTFSKVEPYFAAFVLRNPLLGGGIVVAVSIGMTIAQPLWGILAGRLSRFVLISATAASIVIAASAFLLAGGAGGVAALAAALAFGGASGGLGMATWAAFGDAVANHAVGREGQSYGLFTASAKVSLGVSGLVIGLMLAQIDYRGSASERLVGMMVIPSICAGAVCVLAALWRQFMIPGAPLRIPWISGNRLP